MKNRLFCLYIRLIVMMVTVLLFPACSIFLGFDNPVDPESSEYQGYPTFDDPDLFRAEYPSEHTGELYFLDHFACAEIVGADLYRLQLDNDDSFTSPLFEIPESPLPLFQGTDSPLGETGKILIRYAFRLDNTWSSWSDPVRLTLNAPVIQKPLGTISDTSPEIKWGAIPHAAGYDLFNGSETIRVNDNSYQWTEDLTYGTTLRLLVRAVNADGIVGPWSNAAESFLQPDAAGLWNLRFDWDLDYSYGSADLRLYNDGTFKTTEKDGDKDYGTYTVSGNRIDWYYDDSGTHYTGSFENEDEMSGTMTSSSGDRTGQWNARRKSLF